MGPRERSGNLVRSVRGLFVVPGILSAEWLFSLRGSPYLLDPLGDLLYSRNSCWLRYSMESHYLLGCS